MFHLVLHLLLPLAVALVFYRRRWAWALLVMMASMAVDLDHLLADPIYDPGRCSIGFHPLHRLPAIALYGVLCLFPKTRLVGLGLLIHMALDSIDCQVTNGVWAQ
ncbi:MAG: DUF6122 family protein [Cellvibrionaceae bacterium]|nr:DUF6122 family protein [Cellvibrionaceae bacterium]